MRSLTELQECKGINKDKPLTSNEILNFAPQNLSESLVLQELVQVLKEEIKIDLVSTINHKLR
ncbi:hypothetical protein [Polaribacter sp.]|uniref:hypothetical protein n=1 Tax=Polaribacter sp. TaxID=1920175 RepID=UPI003F6BFB7E